jgi:hypothetical protein
MDRDSLFFFFSSMLVYAALMNEMSHLLFVAQTMDEIVSISEPSDSTFCRLRRYPRSKKREQCLQNTIFNSTKSFDGILKN